MSTPAVDQARAYSFTGTFGRLPGTWPTLVVTVLAGLGEGFGLALFIPLLQMLDGASGGAMEVVRNLFAAVGLPMGLATMLGAIVVLIVGSLGIGLGRDVLLVKAKYRHMGALRHQVIQSLLFARWEHLARQASGQVINQLLTECLRAASAPAYQVLVLAAIVQIAIFSVISALLSWKLFALSVLLAAVVGWTLRPLFRRARTIGEATNRANQNFSFHIVDYLKGMRLVRVTGSEARVGERAEDLNQIVTQAVAAGERILAYSYFSVQALAVVILAFVILISMVLLKVPVSVMLTFLLITARMAPRFVQLQQHLQTYRVYAPAMPVVDDAIARGRAAVEERRPDGHRFTDLTQGVSLENVSYRYADKDRGAVVSLSLDIPCNTMTAIVGASGAGKSTLIDLIAGLRVPDSGCITIDGVDLKTFDLVSWRRRLGYVTQDVIVFNDTLRNNLLFGHPEATQAEIEDAQRTAHLPNIAAGLPDGLDTVLGEGGVRLSGGEKQRLALARALVGKPALLLLDEATSSLDNQSERMIQDAIESIADRFTIVVVAHRLATVRKADRIHVMDQGRIVESGRFDELLESNGAFARLHATQFS